MTNWISEWIVLYFGEPTVSSDLEVCGVTPAHGQGHSGETWDTRTQDLQAQVVLSRSLGWDVVSSS